MTTPRTEREKLVEAANNRTWRCDYRGGDACELRWPGEPTMWCPDCVVSALAAADLLEGERETKVSPPSERLFTPSTGTMCGYDIEAHATLTPTEPQEGDEGS